MSIKTDTPLYEKVGRRYKEVGRHIELDFYQYHKDNPETPSAALLVFQKYSTSYLRNVDIDSAGVVAAMRIAQQAMVDAIVEESKLKPSTPPKMITQEQRDLLDKLEATGFNASKWHWGSVHDIVEAGIKVLEDMIKEK